MLEKIHIIIKESNLRKTKKLVPYIILYHVLSIVVIFIGNVVGIDVPANIEKLSHATVPV